MRHTASVSYHVQSLMLGFEVVVKLYLHIVELYLYSVEKCVVVCRTGRYLIERVDHLDYTVEYSLREHEAEVTGSCGERRTDGILLYSSR